MTEPSREEVEAGAKAAHYAINSVGAIWDCWPDSHKGVYYKLARAALEAAAKVRQKGERRIAYNGTGEEEYASVLMHEDETLKPGEELVIRPIGGKEEKA